jgi:LAO/AO transport system kinase
VVLTDAVHGDGLDDLARALADHRRYLSEEGRLEERRRKGTRAQVVALAAGRAADRVERMTAEDAALCALLERVERREVDPLSAVQELVDRLFGGEQS